jgi:excinuclease ABC subunit C
MRSQTFTKLKLPDNPGVYIFRDYRKRPLYIGRATSLADRVRSYFASDVIVTRGPRIIDMVTKATTVTWQTTDSVLEAILLESNLIKKYQPTYNVDERDDKSAQYVVITDETWPRVFLVRARDLEQQQKEGTVSYPIKALFGPYPHGGLIKEALKIIRKMFPFRDKKSFDDRHNVFYQSLGRSPQSDDAPAHMRYIRTIRYIQLFFQGKKNAIRTQVEKQMNMHAKKLEFEEASRLKKLLYALDHIHDIALIKNTDDESMGDPLGKGSYRIEAYDVAHLSGMETVGTFVVSENGHLVPREYRKFKMAQNTNDDLRNLEETLTRRLNHTEWTYPDLIVVDGNAMHVERAEKVLKIRRINIPVVGVTKNEKHIADTFVGHPDIIERYKQHIVALNAEAHRYTLAYHRKRRSMVQLPKV